MRRRPGAGYSMIELVVVLVISAILAAFAIPLLQQPAIDATWFSEEVRAAVRYAQRQAVAQRRTVHVEVQPTQLRVCYDAGCASPLVRTTNGQSYVLTAPTGVTLSPATTFAFNGLGQSAGIVISVSGQSVTVTAETGYVH